MGAGEHPALPVFASWALHNLFKKRGGVPAGWKALMPYTDLVGVSYYPFFVADADRLAAPDWMTGEFGGFDKPLVVVGTNDAAERLPLPSAKVVIEGTPEKQEAYYRTLLGLGRRRRFAFVVGFVHQDYDALWDRIGCVPGGQRLREPPLRVCGPPAPPQILLRGSTVRELLADRHGCPARLIGSRSPPEPTAGAGE